MCRFGKNIFCIQRTPAPSAGCVMKNALMYMSVAFTYMSRKMKGEFRRWRHIIRSSIDYIKQCGRTECIACRRARILQLWRRSSFIPFAYKSELSIVLECPCLWLHWCRFWPPIETKTKNLLHMVVLRYVCLLQLHHSLPLPNVLTRTGATVSSICLSRDLALIRPQILSFRVIYEK